MTRIGFSTRFANRGLRARTTIPRTTGTQMMAITSATLPINGGTDSGPAVK